MSPEFWGKLVRFSANNHWAPDANQDTVDQMEPSQQQTAVHLKNTHGEANVAFFILGMCCLWAFPTGVVVIADKLGDGLLYFGIPAALFVVLKWLRSFTPEDHAILYADRMELPHGGSERSVVLWSEVETIQWPTSRPAKSIRLIFGAREDKSQERMHVGLSDISRTDRLTRIGYIHLAGAEAEQENWAVFCYRVAVPLLQACRKSGTGVDGTEDGGATRTRPGSVSKWANALADRRPFLTGIASPLLFVLLLPTLASMASRRTYWIVSALVSISAVVNIRLVWGSWASPFTEICFALAGTLKVATPGPKYSIMLPTPPLTVRIWSTLSIISLAVTQGLSFPVNLMPTILGHGM